MVVTEPEETPEVSLDGVAPALPGGDRVTNLSLLAVVHAESEHGWLALTFGAPA